jgi:hypothetical protein
VRHHEIKCGRRRALGSPFQLPFSSEGVVWVQVQGLGFRIEGLGFGLEVSGLGLWV